MLPAPPATTLVGQVCALCGFGPPNVRLVLLDHGLYATLAEPIRRAYCTLWCVCPFVLRLQSRRCLTLAARNAGKLWRLAMAQQQRLQATCWCQALVSSGRC